MSFLSYLNFLVFFLKDSLEVYKWFLLEGIAMDLVIFGGDTLSYLLFVVFTFLNCLLHLKS